jgi:hypothetical protein
MLKLAALSDKGGDRMEDMILALSLTGQWYAVNVSVLDLSFLLCGWQRMEWDGNENTW